MKTLALFFVVIMVLTSAVYAAVTDVTVAKGHTLYPIYHTLKRNGVPFTGHTITTQVSTTHAPAGAQSSDLTIGTVTDVGNGKYRFSVAATSNARNCSTTEYYEIIFRDGTRRNRLLSPNMKVYVKDYSVFAISFKNGSSSDARDVYDSTLNVMYASATLGGYEWSVGQRNDPAAYFKDSSGPKMIKVQLHGPPSTTATVSATGNWGGVSSKSVVFDATGVATVTDFQIVNNPASSSVDEYNITWQWTITSGGNSSVMNTSHKVYITAADTAASPSHGTAYAEIYEVGCNASGTSTGIRTEFDDCQVGAMGKSNYTYYGTSSWAEGNVREMLINGDGDCATWAPFYRDVLALQEVESTTFRIYSQYATYPGIYVRPTGITGQGPTSPPGQNQFSWHAMVTFDSGRFDDPSYGTNDYTGKIPWEDDAFGAPGPTSPGGCWGIVGGAFALYHNTAGEDTTAP